MILNVIKDPEKVLDLAYDYLNDKHLVSYDCETTGLYKGAEVIGISICAQEDIAYYIVLAAWNKETNKLDYLPGMLESATKLIKVLNTKDLIMHNGVFDCAMAESFFKISLIKSLHTDTMILAHLLNENRRVGLKELSKEYFGETSTNEQAEMKASVLANGGELTKSNYEMYKADSDLMGKYGAKDALLTFKLFMVLVPELYEQKLDKFFYEEESMPLLKGPTYELNTIGLKVDINSLLSLQKQLEAECLEAKDYIYQEIAPYIKEKYPAKGKKDMFNIGSSSQLSWLLFGKLELEFNTLTKAGKTICKLMGLRIPYTFTAKRVFIAQLEQSKGQVYKPEAIVNSKTIKAKLFKDPWSYIACDKEALKKLAPKHKWIEKLLEYQRKTKILNTYIKGIQERTQYGIIHPSFLQHGTTSGRYSSRNPNFQNLPRDDKRIKQCIVARPGKMFVGADYSQLEPRVFAYYSKDERLLAAFKGSEDFYSVIGMEVYGKTDCTPHKEGSPDAFGIKYKKLRDLSKVIALATVYGATAHQLMKTTGKNAEDTQEDIDAYLERFPGVQDMMMEAHDLVKTKGQVTNIFGRPRRILEGLLITKHYGKASHADLPYEARQKLNLGVNHRIQSTGASIINRAAIAFYNDLKTAGIDAKLVCQVHDSLIVECNEGDAEAVSLLLQNAMENTTQLEGIALEAIPKIGINLGEV